MKKIKLLSLFILQVFVISTILLAAHSSTLNYLPLINKDESSSIFIKTTLDLLGNNNGTLICNASFEQYRPHICADGAGGAIITWYDHRSGSNEDIYARRILANGSTAWTVNGVAICTASFHQNYPQICSSGADGAIITWQDARSGSDFDIYAQKIFVNGSTAWMADGVAICTASYDQDSPQICSDGMGGAIITWLDPRSGSNLDIYAQRILANGSTVWTANGVVICNASNDQESNQICSDGVGGAIITWQDYRSEIDIYAQKINSAGNVQWIANGEAICTANNSQRHPQICGNGAGGAIITWDDGRSGIDYDIYAQRILVNGSSAWTADGVAICTASGGQANPQICGSGAGGAIITWEDYQSGIDIYAQKINSAGNVQWIPNGEAICTATNDQIFPQICSDGVGGAIITWMDYRTGSNQDIYTQKINSAASVQWTADGVAICTANNDQYYPQICNDGIGGVIITWHDDRGGSYSDIYAQKIIYDYLPTSDHPEDITTTTSDSGEIYWILYDDFGGGQYMVWVNDTNNIYHVWVNWTSWNNNTYIKVAIKRDTIGVFNYTIEYNDNAGLYGISDSVIVNITSSLQPPGPPSEETPIYLLGPQIGGDISSFLFSPLSLGIIASFGVIIIILTIVLSNNNKAIKELNKKISKTPSSKKSIEK